MNAFFWPSRWWISVAPSVNNESQDSFFGIMMRFIWGLMSGGIKHRNKHDYSWNSSKRKGKAKNFAVACTGLFELNAATQDYMLRF